MPFTIDVASKDDVNIQFRIVKNNIGIYLFGGTSETQRDILSNWRHLESHFVSDMANSKHWVRGPDAAHLKLNHTSPEEIDIMHWHIEFDCPVEPAVLDEYLQGMLAQQETHPSNENQFITPYDVNTILERFTEYHHEFVGSSWKAEYDAATKLTGEETRAYDKAVAEDRKYRDLHAAHRMDMGSDIELLFMIMMLGEARGASSSHTALPIMSLLMGDAVTRPTPVATAAASAPTELAVSLALAALTGRSTRPFRVPGIELDKTEDTVKKGEGSEPPHSPRM